MKKKIALLLVAAMASAGIFTGCGSDETEEAVSVSAEEENDEITAEPLMESVDYDITDYVTLPDDYMNMTVELSSDYEVTEDDVREYIENYVLVAYPVYVETVKTVVEDGDIVNIDYVGTLDGEAFDGGTAEGYNLTIGSGVFIDGFEDGLIGVSVGDTVDLNLTFPDDYSSEDLAGQEVVFTVTVNAIMEEQVLAYEDITDDYVAENFSSYYSLNTVDDLKDYIEESLASEYESEKNSDIQNLILEQLKDTCELNIPDDMVQDKVDTFIANIQAGADYYGMDYDTYISSYYGYDDEKEFNEYAAELVTDNLTEELILEAVLVDQNMTIYRSNFDDFVDYFVSYYGYSSTDDLYEDYGGEDALMLTYAENVALNTLMDSVNVVVPESGETDTDENAGEEESAETGDVEADETAEE